MRRDREKMGSFTLPGEAGYEELTLRMAEKWGADVIRDSDGTALSKEILDAGYGIYSTICLIREHNKWAREHRNMLQQTFLMSTPCLARTEAIRIPLLENYFTEQFEINDSEESLAYWQVFDRTAGKEVDKGNWNYDCVGGNVEVEGCIPYHEYTVNFLAYRIWEEISMYNHVTNHWKKEHLMPVDPRMPEAQEYLCRWLEKWCQDHPATTVVRLTSMFYNFVWIWGDDERNRNRYTDWGSYDFTVSPKALEDFKKEYGYSLTAEDFIHQGKFHVTHMPPVKKQLDYMDFTNRFVVGFGKKLVDLIHKYGKKAYVFYDDSWVGIEPYGRRFREFGFDGLIKCVFSGYEARLCAGVDVEIHELRLHPYLFPVGLGGKPTFMKGGSPVRDAAGYWMRIRRALLREPVERIGLGGYLHLVEGYPDFCSYIEKVAEEFRVIKAFHQKSEVYTFPCRVGVLHSWGSLRPWTLSGHFHETYMHDLIHVNEALAGLPVDVRFIGFDDIKTGTLKGLDVVINAGRAGTAWSGGKIWEDEEVVSGITRWVDEGGAFIGIGEPSAAEGYHNYFRMANVLGVDEDTGAKVCHGRWRYNVEEIPGLIPEGAVFKGKENLMLTDGKARVLAEKNGTPVLAVNCFGKGTGVYLSDFTLSNANTRLLLNLLLFAKNMDLTQKYLTDNSETECAYYPEEGQLAAINNSDSPQGVRIQTDYGLQSFSLKPYETQIRKLK